MASSRARLRAVAQWTTPPARENPGFRPEIEGLRAVAVVLVVLDHLVGWPSGGFVGVDVFFVISGFLITGLLLKEHDGTGRISIAGFYRRRARRILPAALTVLVVTWIASTVAFTASRAHTTMTDILWSGAFLANLHFARTDTDYFNADRPPSPVQHFWSLAVEEQFYIFWPVVLIVLLAVAAKLTRRAAGALVAGVTGVLLAALVVLAIAQTSDNAATAYFYTTSRAWELGFGALLAAVLPFTARLPEVARTVAVAAGLVLIVVSALTISPSDGFPAPAALWPVLGAVLVILGSQGARMSPAAWPLINPVSRYVGRVSYSLYLWHWPVVVVLSAYISSDASGFVPVALFAMSALTIASYHLVESPLRTMRYASPATMWRRRHAARGHDSGPRSVLRSTRLRAAVVSLALAELTVMAWSLRPVETPRTFEAFGSTTAASTTRPDSVAAPTDLRRQIAAALGATSWPALSPSLGDLRSGLPPEWTPCGNVGPGRVDACTFTPAGERRTAAKTAVVLGDSIAIAWLPAVRAALAPSGWTVVGLTYGQCPAAQVDIDQQVGQDSGFTRECNDHRRWAVQQVGRIKPGLVVMGSAENSLTRLASKASGDAAAQEWQQGTSTAVRDVRAAGAGRVVVLAPPPAGKSLEACATKDSTPGDCVAPIGDTWQEQVGAEQKGATSAGATYLDTSLLFCSETSYCPPFIGRSPVRVDGNHITADVSRRIGRIIAPQLLGS